MEGVWDWAAEESFFCRTKLVLILATTEEGQKAVTMCVKGKIWSSKCMLEG